MPRAEVRERLRRQQLDETHHVVLTWRRRDDQLQLDVLDPVTRRPLTRQRLIRDPATIYNMVQRSLTGTRPGPRTHLLRANLDDGAGEIAVEITGRQYLSMVDPPHERI